MYSKKNQVLFGPLFRIIVNNKRLSSCPRQITIGFTYTFRIINPLEIIIMMFIRFVLNIGFVKKNLLNQKILRKLSLLCFHQTGYLSYPVPRNRERSLHTCAQDVQITRMATI
jgi:hypothetical protein